MKRFYIPATILLALLASAVRAELIVRNDGSIVEGKVRARDAKGLSVQVEGQAAAQQLSAETVTRVLEIDEKGAFLAEGAGVAKPERRAEPKWDVPKEPAAPPIPATAPAGPTYYVIPLHGEVGQTFLADALEKSLADAVKRKPTVVVLDINSPGGLVQEAQLMVKTLHKYNKELRIVALAEQDLSAAAVTTLSAKTIYLKSTGMIGAATAYNGANPDMPQALQEKMQSVWRAVARNSAEEGGHDPLLAEAMIDTSKELHLETVDGQKVVREGPGAKLIVAKGKILTLTSHEAVDCGLAAGIADDFDELGTELKLKGWKEMPGLGKVLADYLPKRQEAYESKAKEIADLLKENVRTLQGSAPSEEILTQRIITGAPALGPTMRGNPGRTGLGPGGAGRSPAGAGRGTVTEIRTVSPESRAQWKQRSLASVLALQKMEQNLQDEISLANAFGHQGAAEELKDILPIFADARAKLFAERNKYAGDTGRPVAPPRGGTTAGGAPAAGSAGDPPALTANNAPLAASFAKSVAAALDKKRNRAGDVVGGGLAREAFDDVAPEGGLLIGLRCGMGKFVNTEVIASVQPVYLTAKGVVVGKLHGNPAATPVVDLIAKDGYAVGGAKIGGGANLEVLALIFVRLGEGDLNYDDSYQSPLLGNTDQYTRFTATTPVVGITGKTNNSSSLGLGLAFMTDSSPLTGRNQPFPLSDKLPPRAEKTEQAGGNSGSPFVRVDRLNRPMVGVKIRMGDSKGPIVAQVDPLYVIPEDQLPSLTFVVANDGYAVGGIEVNADTAVRGIRVQFMRLKDGKLDPGDHYASDWVGTQDAGAKSLGGTGAKVIGLFGRQGTFGDAVGLVTIPAPAASSKLVVRKAVYGDLVAGRVIDVTQKVSDMIEKDTLTAEVNDDNFTDPANGAKMLRVDYTFEGVKRTKVTKQGQALIISSDGF